MMFFMYPLRSGANREKYHKSNPLNWMPIQWKISWRVYKLLIGSFNYRSISIFKEENRSTFKKKDGHEITRLNI